MMLPLATKECMGVGAMGLEESGRREGSWFSDHRVETKARAVLSE